MLFNAREFFTKQFVPYENGYLYFPSKKAGGKLVTAEEYEALLQEWQGLSSFKNYAITMACTLVAIFAYAAFAFVFDPPDWTMYVVIVPLVTAFVGRALWIADSPRRLVRGREDAVPPRRASESRKAARAMLS